MRKLQPLGPEYLEDRLTWTREKLVSWQTRSVKFRSSTWFDLTVFAHVRGMKPGQFVRLVMENYVEQLRNDPEFMERTEVWASRAGQSAIDAVNDLKNR